MPLIFNRSLIGTATLSYANTQLSTLNTTGTVDLLSSGGIGGSYYAAVKIDGGQNLGCNFTATVYPADNNFYFNSLSAWTIEAFVGVNSISYAPAQANDFFSIDSFNSPKAQWHTDGSNKFFRFWGPNGENIGYRAQNSDILGMNHIAMTSNGNGTFRWFYKGDQIFSTNSYTKENQSRILSIGPCGVAAPQITRMKWDELRISNVERYNSGFTPPTSAFTTDENTLALFHMDQNNNDSSRG